MSFDERGPMEQLGKARMNFLETLIHMYPDIREGLGVSEHEPAVEANQLTMNAEISVDKRYLQDIDSATLSVRIQFSVCFSVKRGYPMEVPFGVFREHSQIICSLKDGVWLTVLSAMKKEYAKFLLQAGIQKAVAAFSQYVEMETGEDHHWLIEANIDEYIKSLLPEDPEAGVHNPQP